MKYSSDTTAKGAGVLHVLIFVRVVGDRHIFCADPVLFDQIIILAALLFFEVLSNDLGIKVFFELFYHALINGILNPFKMLVHFSGLLSHVVLHVYLPILFVYGLSKYPKIGLRHFFGHTMILVFIGILKICVFVSWISRFWN